MGTIGFCGSPQKSAFTASDPENLLLQFDSGAGITFADSVYHMIALGTTGSGKTQSAMLPALKRHIEHGNSGIVIDVKGNLRTAVRTIAIGCGRGEAVIEFGTAATATPVNLLATMTPADFYNFCITLLKANCNDQSSNFDFHAKGAGIAKDCFTMLRWMGEKQSEFSPTLPLILEMFGNHIQATALFERFAGGLVEPTQEQSDFISYVKCSNFHVLNQTQEKLNDLTQSQQVNYNTNMIVNAFKEFLDVPNIAKKFCAPGAGGIDMAGLLREGKIICLRLDPQAGQVGVNIGRQMLNSYYEAVYTRGTEPVKGRTTQDFVFIDEFQDVADLSPNRFSDVNFLAQAREFGVAFMAATQSISALINRGVFSTAAEAFVSNCNNKIFFFSDDIVTQSVASRYSTVDLINLRPGQAFAVRYDSDSREHRWGMETLNEAYRSVMELGVSETPAATPAEAPAAPTLGQLVTLAGQNAPGVPVRREAGQPRWGNRMPAEERGSGFERKIDENASRDKFMAMFPDLFSENANIRVPPGWQEAAEKALKGFQALGSGIKIDFLTMGQNGGLEASIAGRRLAEIKMLNRLLEKTRGLCVFCGAALEKREAQEEPVRYSRRRGYENLEADFDDTPMPVPDAEPSLPICGQCGEEFGCAGN